ncbi:hypothetical protein [Nocardiopsis salina]|uniref:hypothetical protein n=1 Tax=Nocardiopsis salina TaxID=245836 RepID=UPI00034624DE|nr:hypothetical protein [Nocardiopsis salina]
MDILFSFLLFLHFIGLAGIIGGFLTQALGSSAPKAPKVILHSSLLQLVSGLGLVAILEMDGGVEVDHMKITAKTVVMVGVLVAAIVNTRNPGPRPAAVAGALAVLNTGIAVFV